MIMCEGSLERRVGYLIAMMRAWNKECKLHACWYRGDTRSLMYIAS